MRWKSLGFRCTTGRGRIEGRTSLRLINIFIYQSYKSPVGCPIRCFGHFGRSWVSQLLFGASSTVPPFHVPSDIVGSILPVLAFLRFPNRSISLFWLSPLSFCFLHACCPSSLALQDLPLAQVYGRRYPCLTFNLGKTSQSKATLLVLHNIVIPVF